VGDVACSLEVQRRASFGRDEQVANGEGMLSVAASSSGARRMDEGWTVASVTTLVT